MQKYIYIYVYPRLKRLINTLFLASPHYTVFRYDGPVYLLYVNGSGGDLFPAAAAATTLVPPGLIAMGKKVVQHEVKM